MGKNLEKAIELRNDPAFHYNCAQAVVCAFEKECGLSREQAKAVGANFGSGMKMAATCGAVTGGLMVLGLMGIEDGPAIAGFQRAVRDNHSGCLNCADLLRMNKEKGGEKKAHCDGMVYEAVGLVEHIIEEKMG
jgi:C_GCAxxG_C_C family probable redox protein